MNPLISTWEADALIRSAIAKPGVERVPLARGIGRTLAQPVVADRALPPYERAMMDGIAFPSATSQPFQLQGLHAAGDPPHAELRPGHAWEIMTGACLPVDCDTVVPYEHLSEDHCRILSDWQPGQCIHAAGSDAGQGDVLVDRGVTLGAPEIAIAASVGMAELEVIRHPGVALISSGNEAVAVEDQPMPWQIRRSNGPMLEAILCRAGMPPVSHRHVGDDEGETHDAIDKAMVEADVVILCGGISKGKKDLMRPLLEGKLGPPLLHGVAQKPGKPLAVWSGPPFVFALPGNPVSVLATFSRYVIPALKQWCGMTCEVESQSLPEGVKPLARMAWLLALDTRGEARLVSNSGDFVSLAGAVGFLEVPPGPAGIVNSPLPYYPCIF